MPYRNNGHTLPSQDESNVMSKAGQIDAPIPSAPLTPQERITRNRSASTLHFDSETSAEARHLIFVILGGRSGFEVSFR